MATSRVFDALHALARPAEEGSDNECLQRFLARQDEAAFAELVKRHGPMVYGVCRRVLNGGADVDDAFQATFFVLARRAGSVRGGQLGAWLYGVAVRVANKARVQAAKRRARQMAAARPEAVPSTLPQADLWAVIDEELGKLPDDLRLAVLACDVEGKARVQAARDLGWSEGTVAKRLAKARERLAERLARRGISLSAAALAAALADGATAAVPGALLAEAARQAVSFAVGGAGSPAVQALAEAVMRSLEVGVLKAWVFVGLLGVALAGGSVMLAGGSPDEKPTSGKAAVPKVVENAPNVRPAPVKWKGKATLDMPGKLPVSVVSSGDGKVIVVGDTDGKVTAFDVTTQKKRWQTEVGGSHAAVALSADQKTVYATFPSGIRLLDAATGARQELEIQPFQKGDDPATSVAAFPDLGNGKKGPKIAFGNAIHAYVASWTVDAATGGVVPGSFAGSLDLPIIKRGERPADGYAVPLAADPAGRYVLMTAKIPDKNKNVLMAHWLLEEENPPIPLLVGHTARVISAAWSADGTAIVSGDADGRVIVWDGKTFKEKQRLELGGRAAALAISRDATHVAAVVLGKQADFYVWATAWPTNTMKPIHTDADDFDSPTVTASLAFSADGKQLAGCSVNKVWLSRPGERIGKVRVWEVAEELKAASPKEIPPSTPVSPNAPTTLPQTVPTHRTAVFAWAPDGKSLIAGGIDGVVTGRDAAKLTEGFGRVPNTRRVNPGPQAIHAAAYSPDGKFFAISHRDGVSMIDGVTHNDALFPRQKEPLMCEPTAHPYAVAFSAKGRLFAYGTAGGTVRVLDTWTGDVLQAFKAPLVASPQTPPERIAEPVPLALAFSPDGTKLAFGVNALDPGSAARVRVVEPRTGRPLGTVDGTDGVAVLAWSPDGKRLATGGLRTATGSLWDADADKAVSTLGARGGLIRGLSFLPDGKTLVIAEHAVDPQSAGRVRWHDLATGKDIAFLPLGKGETPGGAAVSPDGAMLGVSTLDAAGRGTLRLVSLTEADKPGAPRWKVEKTIIEPPMQVTKISWTAEKPVTDPRFDIEALAVSPDGKRFAISYGGRTEGYDLTGMKKLYTVEGRFPRFVGDGLLTWDGHAAAYDAATGKETKQFPAAKGVLAWQTAAFSPDGKNVAGFDGDDVHLRVVATGAEGGKLKAPPAGPGQTRLSRLAAADVAWSPDGTQVAGFMALNRGDNNINGGPTVWDVATGSCRSSLERTLSARTPPRQRNEDQIRNTVLAYSPDATMIAVGTNTTERASLALLDAATLRVLRPGMIPNYGTQAGGVEHFDLTAAAFSPDGATIAVALRRSTDKGPRTRVEIYNTQDDKFSRDRKVWHDVPDLAPDTPPITGLAYTTDGRTLIAVTGSGVVPVPNKQAAVHSIQVWRKASGS
ncbi:sigma-70 family RNA polymerase sigma factor [Limnoglobus roseus]|uniref:RNA polymerase sigma factor n=1 Tax=Limnoglobus roseus TaxID=2598579 RepID=A0A5C1AAP7_9BACT|nr:sigma-70 family RNA polymerase sigma factor [Limnoglobus roseus]QEL15096.1 RNA polymerase sigma factor [Limnoglobus roseus]